MKASLEHQLWEVLKHHAKGLTVPEVEKSLDGGSDSSKVPLVLSLDCKFAPTYVLDVQHMHAA